jgi:hypothetical protein
MDRHMLSPLQRVQIYKDLAEKRLLEGRLIKTKNEYTINKKAVVEALDSYDDEEEYDDDIVDPNLARYCPPQSYDGTQHEGVPGEFFDDVQIQRLLEDKHPSTLCTVCLKRAISGAPKVFILEAMSTISCSVAVEE